MQEDSSNGESTFEFVESKSDSKKKGPGTKKQQKKADSGSCFAFSILLLK